MSVKDSSFTSPYGDSYKAYITVSGDFSSGIDIISNTFSDGSGILIDYMNGGNINQNTFSNLTGSTVDSPPAISISGGVWDINENTFVNIVGGKLSAVNLYYADINPNITSNFSLNTNTFTNCTSPAWYGGAVYFYAVLGEMSDCTFTTNSATLGGAVFLTQSNVTIEKCTFTSNYAELSGGAIDIERESTLFLYESTFNSNTAGSNNTVNSIDCCELSGAGQCTSYLYVNDKSQGDYVNENTCQNIEYVSTNEYFETLASYPYQPINQDGGSLWWVWLLVSFALIATIIVVGVAVGAFIYTKKKRSYESYA